MKYLEEDELIDNEKYLIMTYDSAILSAKYSLDKGPFILYVFKDDPIVLDWSEVRYVLMKMFDAVDLVKKL